MNIRDNQNNSLLSDGPPMPEMCEALLSPRDVDALFQDLASCTSILSVQEKGSETGCAEDTVLTLATAQQRLLSHSVRAVQIRYRYDNHDWSDTLIHLPDGIRLVRCQHPE
ncbi:MAG: hypothetical protein RIK87_14045 [Fuerstiella sp.]